jgi:hypothetical protein
MGPSEKAKTRTNQTRKQLENFLEQERRYKLGAPAVSAEESDEEKANPSEKRLLKTRPGFVAGILQGALLIKQVYNVHRKYNIWIMEIFRSGEIEIKETLTAVVLNSANCTVLTVQLTIAKLGRTKLNLNPSGAAGAELELEDVVVTSLVRENALGGSANAGTVVEPVADFSKSTAALGGGDEPCAENRRAPKKL